jgi:hypothetical protein
MAVGDYVGKGSPDGTSFGQSATDLISLYGATPVAQRANAAQGTFTSTMNQTTGFGFATQTAADKAVALLNEMRTVLVALGAMKGSA